MRSIALSIIPLIVIPLIVAGFLFKTVSAQVYDYGNDSVPAPAKTEKIYPAVILSPEDFRAIKKKGGAYDTIPVSRQPYALRVDSTSTHFRMMERMQRLPGNERWDQYNPPGRGSNTEGAFRRKYD